MLQSSSTLGLLSLFDLGSGVILFFHDFLLIQAASASLI